MKGKYFAILLLAINLLGIISANEGKINVRYEELKPLEVKNLTEITYPEIEVELEQDLKQEYENLTNLELKNKVAACVILIKNSLSKGNTDVTITLKETKHPKDKTFDKIFSMMLENCVENIEERIVSHILNPENFQIWEGKYLRLLSFNKNIFQIIGPDVKYTPREKSTEQLEIIDRVKLTKIEKKQFGIFGKYYHYCLGGGIGLVLFVFYLVIRKLIK